MDLDGIVTPHLSPSARVLSQEATLFPIGRWKSLVARKFLIQLTRPKESGDGTKKGLHFSIESMK